MTSTIIPTLRYEDAPVMIDWLCGVFGFERRMIVESDNGGIAHAQLTLGSGMVMLGSAGDDAFSRLQPTPKALAGTTQSPYIVVPDADSVYQRAAAAGAEIVMTLKDEEQGGRGFSCRDPEGHLWNVGTYDPWAAL